MIQKHLSTLACSILTISTLVGCGGSSSDDSADNSPAPTDITVQGKAAKGIIVGGVVTIHPLENGEIDLETILATSTTDINGAYTVAIDGYDGSPVIVRVSPAADGTSTMRCDLSSGCGGTAFGDDVPLTDTNFSLDALIPAYVADMPVNVSVVTDTAASVAIEALADSADKTSSAAAEIIADANSSVGNRFGFTGDITQLPVIDITDPAAVVDVEDDVVEYNVLNAAIIEAMISGNTDVSIETAVNTFAEQYIEDGGVSDTEASQTEAVTLSEILQKASEVISAIESEDTLGLLDLGTLEAEILVSAANAEQGSTDPSDGSPAEGRSSELAAVKTMVSNLRNLGHGINLEDASEFSEEIELATDVFDNNATEVLEATVRATAAISAAYEAKQDDESLTVYIDELSGIEVGISGSATQTTYAVDETIAVERYDDFSGALAEMNVDVSLSAVVGEYTIDEVDSGYIIDEATGSESRDERVDVNVGFNFTGTSTSEFVSLSINSGELIAIGSVDSSYSASDLAVSENNVFNEESNVTLDITSLIFDLNISLSEVGVENPVTFNGVVEFTVSQLLLTNMLLTTEAVDLESGDFVGFSEEIQSSVTFDDVTFLVSGEFSSEAGESISASLAINASASDVTVECEESFTFDNLIGSELYEDSCEGETASNYAELNFALMFNLDLSGIANDIRVELSGERTGIESGLLGVELSYGSIMFDVEYNSENGTENSETISITNESNVIATLVGSEAENGDASLNGVIELNGVQYATISDALGFVTVAYSDGTNESF